MKTSTINVIAKVAAVVAGLGLVMMSVAPTADAASYPVGGQQYYLAGAGVTSSAATVPLTALKTPDGRTLTMSMIGAIGYGTLEPQTVAKVESITFTGITQNVNGTASLTGVTRGIDFVYPYAASTTLRQSHSGGSTFTITNTPNFYYDQFTMNNNNNLFTWPAASTSPASRGYVDYIAFSGAGVINADPSNKGIVQIGTGAQAAASTALGSTGAYAALSTSIATSTWNSATAANKVLVTGVGGKIDNNFIATSTLLSATSTINIGAFPAWQIGKQLQVFSSTGTSTFTVPSGITKVSVETQAAGGAGGACTTSISAAGGGAGGGYSTEMVDVTGTTTIQVYVPPASTSATAGAWATFGTNGFYLSATGGNPGAAGTPSTASIGGIAGVGVGGDLNFSGDSGGTSSFDVANANTTASGKGGTSRFGGGAPSVAGTSAGTASLNYGGGGSGAACATSVSNAGGSGAQGLVTIRW